MGKIIEFSAFKKTDDFVTKNETSDIGTINTKNRLYILIGIPGSGKTYYANNHLNKMNTVIVSTDEIRKELTGTYKFSSETNEEVFRIAKSAIKGALSNGFDVGFDATNTIREYRISFHRIAKDTNADVIAIVFKTQLSLCLKRNSTRNIERIVPENVIIGMSTYDSNICKSEGFSEVHFVNSSLNKKL
ncbi:AAA family ATPase [Clostridium estertheticum]|uniref:AAA family ATPase n=1 Tax=Clostridium estertheticum TaxID=238834 RepID=UPI001C7DA51D|nr:AAA family ATPase [Clostridium estertheticum]MBX4270070.1 ATP-binding protein [Clostridium estertheticum]WLC80273.1 ATP-binding protein [Clostridium estertheticum]